PHFPPSSPGREHPKPVPFETGQGQNKPRSGIGAGGLRLRSLRVDLYAELHDVENGRPADSAPRFTRLARISFNWRELPLENLKSSCFSRHKPRLRKS